MATEEVNKPSSLPPYPEMIMKALDGLSEAGGSNKSAISKYIESTYGELPEGHTTLLSHHLNKMKDSGELVFLKNNYMKPDPEAPPKKRPWKATEAKGSTPSGNRFVTTKAKGRPPKDPNAPPKSPKSNPSGGSGRPRGRPKKIQRGAAVAAPPPSMNPPSTPGRGRGRPPKVKPQLTEVSIEL